ncbi:MAG: hypothetical protein VYC95_08950, partial [Verrucomicrobiota bacterium]|nr:hypothetical protein [Verrucomicrobiota bacterium]
MKIHPATAILALLIATLAVANANIYKTRINPHWAPDGAWMWYRNDLPEGEREFILVDLNKGLRQQAFDHDKLATALKEAGAGEPGATQ